MFSEKNAISTNQERLTLHRVIYVSIMGCIFSYSIFFSKKPLFSFKKTTLKFFPLISCKKQTEDIFKVKDGSLEKIQTLGG